MESPSVAIDDRRCFRSPALDDDAPRTEFVVAISRVFLSSAALLAVCLDPTKPTRYVGFSYPLLIAYVAFAIIGLAAAKTRPAIANRLRLPAHTVDVLFAIVLTLATHGPNSPFFMLFVYAQLIGAYRWGFRGAVLTGSVAIALLGVEAVVAGSPSHSMVLGAAAYDVSRLIMRTAYVIVIAILLGYLAEKERQRRREAVGVGLILGNARATAGLGRTLQAVLGSLGRLFGATHVSLIVEDRTIGRAFLWEPAVASAREHPVVTRTELDDDDRVDYLFDVPAETWYARRYFQRSAFRLVGLDAAGRLIPATRFELPRSLCASHRIRSILGASLRLADGLSGRILILNPRIGFDKHAAIRFAARLAREVEPVACEISALGHLRSRAEAVERKRIARELHDGVAQALAVAEMRLQIARNHVPADLTELDRELRDVQSFLREEAAHLRVVIQGMRADTNVGCNTADVASLVERFQRDTGIAVQLSWSEPRNTLSGRSRHEVLRIVEEALTNIRKHSGARHALIRAAVEDGHWKLTIEDDGRGFPFSGRLSQADLDRLRLGPGVIRERIRDLGGDINVESTPGASARLELAVPVRR